MILLMWADHTTVGEKEKTCFFMNGNDLKNVKGKHYFYVFFFPEVCIATALYTGTSQTSYPFIYDGKKCFPA